MSTNPGHDGTPLSDPTSDDLARAKSHLALLSSDGRKVKISELAVLWPGVSRRYVGLLLENLRDQGHIKEHRVVSPNGKGSWLEYTVNS